MIINGNLDLSKTKIQSLGNLKEVKGELNISETKISFIPKDLIFKRIMFFDSVLHHRFDRDIAKPWLYFSKEFLLNKYPQIFK